MKKKQTDQQKKTALRKRCVELAKKIVRHQSNYQCVYCGRKEPIIQTHGSHIYCENSHKSMSADLDNILCLCAGHHVGMGNVTPNWHKDPKEMMKWFETTYPELSRELEIRKNKNQKIDWKLKLGELKSIYGELIN